MTRRRRLILFSCSILIALNCLVVTLIVVVLNRIPQAQASDRRIVYGLTLRPSGFDPHVNASSELTIPLRSVYDTLVYRDPVSKQIVPGLAEKIEISPDGLTYTFHLKQGVHFHDGTQFDAAAVAANLDRITNPETRSQKALFSLGPYDKYVVTDPYTIQIVLKAPYAPLLDALSQTYLGIASPTALKEYDRDRYQLHQVGTGPYIMVSYVPGDYMLLRRNADYTWGPPFYRAANPSPVEEVEFRFFEEPATRAPALESNAAQVMGEIAPTDAIILARNPDLALIPQKLPGMPFQFFFNTRQSPTDKVEIRRALIQATNRVSITDSVFQQLSPPAFGPLTEVTPFYDARVKQMYLFDADSARKVFEAQGYTFNAGDKALEKDGQRLSLIMIVPSWSLAPQIAQKIQSQWREQGITLELKQVPNLAGLLAAVKEPYHLVAFNDNGVDASILSHFYLSDSANNFAQVANRNLDALLNRGAQALDPVERQNIYSEAQALIMSEALILPIRDTVNINGATTRIANLQFDAYGWAPLLWNVTLKSGS